MTNDSLIQKITVMLPEAQVKMGTEFVEVTLNAEGAHDFLASLKKDPGFDFDYLFCLTGADFEDHLKVIYHLESTRLNHIVVVKVKTADRINPVVDSVDDLWPTAEPHENEAFDLLGITFRNHPAPRRLFLDEGWGYPLRKDFHDDIHVVSR